MCCMNYLEPFLHWNESNQGPCLKFFQLIISPLAFSSIPWKPDRQRVLRTSLMDNQDEMCWQSRWWVISFFPVRDVLAEQMMGDFPLPCYSQQQPSPSFFWQFPCLYTQGLHFQPTGLHWQFVFNCWFTVIPIWSQLKPRPTVLMFACQNTTIYSLKEML